MEENVENCGYFVTQEQHERIIKEVPKYVKPLVECYGKIGEILQSIEEKRNKRT
ncbi:MAG: hypothetical protein GY834_02550 [Bacteroidetes bacterium]|nr:hypothetical protein [Bacteroidota bacterium]